MVILFKREHVQPILCGVKTQTRRIWSQRRVTEGSFQGARTKLFGENFAMLKILKVVKEPLKYMTDADARAEGYPTVEVYYEKFAEIYGADALKTYMEKPLYAITFEVVR